MYFDENDYRKVLDIYQEIFKVGFKFYTFVNRPTTKPPVAIFLKSIKRLLYLVI